MKIKTIAATASLIAGLSVAPMTLWACDMAGPNAHVGVITQINDKTMSFTIRDAQTQRLITFTVSKDMLDRLMKSTRVLVKYKKDQGKLVATSIKV